VNRPLTHAEQQYINDAMTMMRCASTEAERRESLELLYRTGLAQGGIDVLRENLKEAA
jgi:hypothetical protein